MSPERKKICFRIPIDTAELLDKVCEGRGEDRAVFARRAVLKELASLGFLSKEQMKALGIKAE